MEGFEALLGNFLSAFSQSRLLRDKTKDQEDERKARTKLFEIQLKQAQDQQQGSDQLRSMMSPQPVSLGVGGVTQRPGMSLSQLLADPQGALALLQSGQLKDVAALDTAQRGQEMRDRMFGLVDSALGGESSGGGMQLSGFGLDSSGNMMPNFDLPQVTTQTVQTPQGPRIQTLNVRDGSVVADLGAPQETNINTNEAGRIQGLFGAQELVKSLKSGFLKPDGSVNRQAVLTAFGPGLPYSAGRTLSSQFEDAADAIIRARTGATANVEEIQGIARQFKPNPLDNDATIKDKLARFERFSAGALDAVTLPPRLRELAEKAGAGLGGEFEGFSIVRD